MALTLWQFNRPYWHAYALAEERLDLPRIGGSQHNLFVVVDVLLLPGDTNPCWTGIYVSTFVKRSDISRLALVCVWHSLL